MSRRPRSWRNGAVVRHLVDVSIALAVTAATLTAVLFILLAGVVGAQPVDIPSTRGGDFWSRPRLTGSCTSGIRVVTRRAASASSSLALATAPAAAQDPLPSWNDGAPKKAIVEFVAKVTKTGGPDFVPPAQRIATFDNDGTLWAEQPAYFQLAFALDRVKALAPQHPEWKDKEPFASLLKGDVHAALAGGERAIVEIISMKSDWRRIFPFESK